MGAYTVVLCDVCFSRYNYANVLGAVGKDVRGGVRPFGSAGQHRDFDVH